MALFGGRVQILYPCQEKVFGLGLMLLFNHVNDNRTQNCMYVYIYIHDALF